MEAEASFAAPSSGSKLRDEPFRWFFVLGAVLSWLGVGHWLFYVTGVTRTYSCQSHGLIQTQGFLVAFALGFLLTALPRRTRSQPPTVAEIAVFTFGLLATTIGALAEDFAAAQIGYIAIFLALIRFAASRFLGAAAGRRPPAAFVLIPIAVMHGLVGALLIAVDRGGDQWVSGLGFPLVEQGVFLCLVVGVGGLILPLMSGTPPPPDLGSSPRETKKAILYAMVGITVFASFWLEHAGSAIVAPVARALAVSAGFAVARAWQLPKKPGLHRRVVWFSMWMIPLGLLLSVVFPDFRVAALHLTFVAGFGLMAFAVATHVSLSHLGMEDLATGRPWVVKVLVLTFVLAAITRVAADRADLYFEHLALASAFWLVGAVLWVAFFVRAFVKQE